MRSPYEEFVASDIEDTKNSAIPYHARENSLPFSYGQINKTSTPLKSSAGGLYSRSNGVGKTSAYDYYSNSMKDENFNLNRDLNYENGYNRNDKITTAKILDNGADGAMIKTQPRLTSPLLVRKTLSSRSPTRNSTNTNTISNTYPYQYGGPGKDYGSYGSRLSENNNTYANKSSYSYSSNNSSGYNNIYGNNTQRKTPTRNDFEDLLRERREKVYNEYRSTAHDVRAPSPTSSSAIYRNKPPQPPQRSTYTNGGSIGPQSHQRNQPANKYNYDFEFNLNLDDLPRRPNTIERTSSLQYRTRDIPVARETSYVERNYHTISSSTNANRGETSNPIQERPPLELAYNRRYGNGNASGYGGGADELDNISRIHELREGVNAVSLNANRSINDLSPIYATTTKKQMTTTSDFSAANATFAKRTNRSVFRQPDQQMSNELGYVGTLPRPETPAFPVTPRTPHSVNYGNNASTPQPHGQMPRRLDYPYNEGLDLQKHNSETIYQTTYRSRLGSNISMVNSEPQEVAAHLVKFAKDSSKFWYKPNLSREEAISLLLNATPGTFVIRNSTTYKDAYGLVLRVAQPPPGSSSGKPDELVRHFLIEPTTRGVRLKGSANEPVFTSLSAFVYEHSVNQIALPCLLRIPEKDVVPSLIEPTPAQKQLLTQGAACNVLWLYSCETESLTGEEAIRKAIRQLYELKPLPTPTEVHFKVSQHGITLTDNTRKKFFRKHYTADVISFCAIDPDHRLWTVSQNDSNGTPQVGELKKTIFAFVARRSPSSKDNQCHVFCDLAINQPASAIASFVNKILPTEKQRNYVL